MEHKIYLNCSEMRARNSMRSSSCYAARVSWVSYRRHEFWVQEKFCSEQNHPSESNGSMNLPSVTSKKRTNRGQDSYQTRGSKAPNIRDLDKTVGSNVSSILPEQKSWTMTFSSGPFPFL